MPVIEGLTTKEARSVWRSPDGQREIFEVTFDYQGKTFKAKTYSKDISNVGWSGTVESYEKQGRNGSETFVKQPPKEDGGYRGGGGGRSGGNYQPKDEKAIQAMWAIGQSVGAHVGSEGLDVTDFASIEAYAIELNAMVDKVKGTVEAETETPTQTTVDEVVEVNEDEPLDLSAIDDILGGGTKVDDGEDPWNKNKS